MLTQVATVKQAIIGIGETPPAAHDTEIQRLIDAISRDVESFCGRKFTETAYTGELHSGQEWQKYLYPRHWPISGTITVTLKTSYDSSAETIAEGTARDQYVKIYNTWGELHAFYRPKGWASIPLGITVGYTGGYKVYPDASPTIPKELEDVAARLVAQAYLLRGKGGLSQESFQGLSLSFPSDLWPRDLKDRLERRFMRRRVV